MLINSIISKKLLEALIHEIYSTNSIYATEYLLDALKNLGFQYATNSGLSISIEDLKTPLLKELLLQETNKEIALTSDKWERGFLTDAERFHTIIDTWTKLTESLKSQILTYYEEFDPLNSLYVMSSSGARGNTSQVGQLIGMRGLMSDQKGQIIDLPIQSNFREGLTPTDYLVSSYGARKGIVDTALRTADAGYLTRTLIYLAQDLIVRVHDCKTTNGISVVIMCEDDFDSNIGRVLISFAQNGIITSCNGVLLTTKLAQYLSLNSAFPLTLKVRSILTCSAHGSVCQACYGWDLAERSPIALGEAVGIIAAQSIGEPGTQLTMRTFHTGGVFAGEKADQIIAPFSGWLEVPSKIKGFQFRSLHGENAIELKENVSLRFVDWMSNTAELELSEGAILYLTQTGFVKENQIVGEHKKTSAINAKRRLMPIRTPFAGELLYNHSAQSSGLRKKVANRTQGYNIVWIASGKICSFPEQTLYTFPKKLSNAKAFGILKIISPFSGHIKLEKSKLSIYSDGKTTNLLLDVLEFNLEGCMLNFSILVKNHQYVDDQTVVALVSIFPKYEGKIYLCKKRSELPLKKSLGKTFDYQSELIDSEKKLFFITKADTWSINSDQANNLNLALQGSAALSGHFFHKNIKSGNSGFLLDKNGTKAIFQNAYPIFLGHGTRLSCQNGDFILSQQIVASQIRTTLRTEDIVQGIPKVFALIQGHHTKKDAMLVLQTGVFVELSAITPLLKKGNKIDNFTYEKMRNMQMSHMVTNSYATRSRYSTNQYCWLLLRRWASESGLASRATLRKNKKLNQQMTFSAIVNAKLSMNAIYDTARAYRAVLKTVTKKSSAFRPKSIGSFSVDSLLKPAFYGWPTTPNLIPGSYSFVAAGQSFTKGLVDPHTFLQSLLKIESSGTPLTYPNFGLLKGDFQRDDINPGQEEVFAHQLSSYPMQIQRALVKFRELLANSILGIYYSQGVTISSKHLELMVSRLTSKAIIKRKKGLVPINQVDFYEGETVELSLIEEVYKSCLESDSENERICPPIYLPSYSSATHIGSLKDGFLAPAASQQTKKVLTKAAIFGKCDWLRNLKENVIVGRTIPAGTTHFAWTNKLDAIYFFKNARKYEAAAPADNMYDDEDILDESEMLNEPN